MQILHQDAAHGRIKIIPNTLDDLWHLYHVISPGDLVEGASFRRIRQADEDSRRPDKGERKRIFIALQVESLDFHEFSDALRVKGVITESSDDSVPLGSYHTFNITVSTTITIIKPAWDALSLKRLRKAISDTHKAQLAILAIEDGQAQFAIVTNIGISPGPEITMSIPGKREKGEQRETAFQEYIETLLKVLHEFWQQKQPGKVLIVGPGSTKNYFFSALQRHHPAIAQISIVDTVSSGTMQGINEAINQGKLLERIGELDVLANTRLMEELLEHVAKGDGLVTYGEKEVEIAAQRGAVKILLVSESNLRLSNPQHRKMIERLVHMAEQQGASIHFLSKLYPAGKQLENIGGVAAILRYRIN